MEPVKTCQPLMKIERLVMTQDHLNKISQKDDSIVQPTGNLILNVNVSLFGLSLSFNHSGILQQLKHSIKKIAPVSLKSFLMGIFPILAWLPEYSWKDNFVSDLVSGCTIAVIQIPQGKINLLICWFIFSSTLSLFRNGFCTSYECIPNYRNLYISLPPASVHFNGYITSSLLR